MVEFKKNNIFCENVEAIVNPVNCVGVMGKGLALQFKKFYPENFTQYQDLCKSGTLKPGVLFVYETNLQKNPKFIINFPTKKHWKEKSDLEDIKLGLIALCQVIDDRGIKSIAIPPLGCGLGGLEWFEVKQHIQKIVGIYFRGKDIRIVLLEPSEVIC